MTVDDERAARTMLADLTAGQPAAPPGRLGAVRRRAVLRRRRQFVALAAVVAIVAVAAATVPLRLLGTAPPVAPTSYHLSEQPPGPHARPGLIATGIVNGQRWSVTLSHESGSATGPHGSGTCATAGQGTGIECAGGPVRAASRTGEPVNIDLGAGSANASLDIATTRSDVTAVAVRYTNGQSLTLHPVSVFGNQSASYVAIAEPHPGSVVSVAAFAGHRGLGYAVPFSTRVGINLVRWLRPGQPARPRPLIRVIGSGSAGGSSWTMNAAIGPWGTCIYTGDLSSCRSSPDPKLPPGAAVYPGGGMNSFTGGLRVYSGEAAPSVHYLRVTTQDGATIRVPVVAVGALRFYACADVQGNRIVRWAAYDAAGHLLARSKPGQIP
jgi:hypothetical protein